MKKIEREMKDVILIEFSNEKQFDKKKLKVMQSAKSKLKFMF